MIVMGNQDARKQVWGWQETGSHRDHRDQGDAEIRGTVLLTLFHFAIYSLYDSVTDTCQP